MMTRGGRDSADRMASIVDCRARRVEWNIAWGFIVVGESARTYVSKAVRCEEGR